MTENVELYDNKCRILCIKLTIMDAPTLCQLLRRIKELAVWPQNNLINVVKLLELAQEREEPVKNFLARLKGAANVW